MWTLSDPGQPGRPVGEVAPAQALAPAGRTEGGPGRALFICAGVPGQACRSMFCTRNISIYFCIGASAYLPQTLSTVLGLQLTPSAQVLQHGEKRPGSPGVTGALHTRALSWWALPWQHLTPPPCPLIPSPCPHLNTSSAPAPVQGPTVSSCSQGPPAGRHLSHIGFPVVPCAPQPWRTKQDQGSDALPLWHTKPLL